MHGDAAFAGQGLVPRPSTCRSSSRLPRSAAPSIFIVNNQIGFTTNPVNSRSGPYCSEVAKIIQAPIFHVNGDDPEAVVHVARIATEFRPDVPQGRRDRHVLLPPLRSQRGRRAGLHPAAHVQEDRQHPTDPGRSTPSACVKEGRDHGGRGREDGRRASMRQLEQDFEARLEATSPTRPTGWKAPGRAWSAVARLRCPPWRYRGPDLETLTPGRQTCPARPRAST